MDKRYVYKALNNWRMTFEIFIEKIQSSVNISG